MKINHLSFPVSDLAGAADFFIKFFDFELVEQKGGFVAILSDGDGFTLVLTKSKVDGINYPTDFHFGFLQNSEDQVYAIHKKLTEAGMDIPEPKSIRGSLGFYFNGPDGILMEVSCA
jgi:catechol 2,3-dioxygenase-like lactoylglutathione lyase family enzyme